jgi:hypothetical protein
MHVRRIDSLAGCWIEFDSLDISIVAGPYIVVCNAIYIGCLGDRVHGVKPCTGQAPKPLV